MYKKVFVSILVCSLILKVQCNNNITITECSCRNCTDYNKLFVKYYWFGLMGVEFQCVDNFSQISKYAIVTDAICNKSACSGIVVR